VKRAARVGQQEMYEAVPITIGTAFFYSCRSRTAQQSRALFTFLEESIQKVTLPHLTRSFYPDKNGCFKRPFESLVCR
jgi:hypothetical protein